MNAPTAKRERLTLSGRLVTTSIIRLANSRLAGRKFFRRGKYLLTVDKADAITALLVVRKLSPYLILLAEEEALLHSEVPAGLRIASKARKAGGVR